MENSIYKLIEIRYKDDEPQYPDIDISYETVGYFSSIANAEQAMKNKIEQYGNSNTFGFLLKEYGFDYLKYASTESEQSYLPDLMSGAKEKSVRNYLSDGSFWDEVYNPYEREDLGEFYGRPEEKIRFKPGDIVESIYPLQAVLAIVHFSPPTIEQVNGQRCSYSDRYYTTPHNATWGEGVCTHYHPTGAYLFPPRFPVSDELQKKLKEVYKCIQKVEFGEEISENE